MIEFKTKSAAATAISNIALVENTAMEMEGDPTPISATFSPVVVEAVPETQRVLLRSNTEMGGHFKLELGSRSTRGMDVGISPQRMEDELMYSLGLDSVRVRPIDLTSLEISSSYRAYDIEFVSVAGDVPQMGCNTTGIFGVEKSTGQKTTLSIGIECTVTDNQVAATSNGIGKLDCI